MKYTKTKYPNIFSYELPKGIRYMVRISSRKDGRYKDYSKSGIKSIKDAQKILREFEDKIENYLDDIDTEITLDEYWEIYSRKKEKTKQWNDTSIYTNLGIYSKMIQPFWGEYQLKKINRNSYEEFIAEQLKIYRKNSVMTAHRLLTAILNDAVRNGNIPRNALSGAYIGESTVAPMNKELSLTDFKVWLAKAEEILSKTHYAFVYLTIFGLRRGEVCGLRTMDVTFNSDGRAILHIRDSRSSRTRTGSGRTKTESSVRYVSLDETGSSLLKHSMEEAKKVKKITGTILKPEKDYITISIKNDKLKLEPPSFLNKIFKIVNRETKIHVTPHIMRHFFTTQALIAGVSQHDVMRYVGHTQTRTTSSYTHIRDERTQLVTDTYIDSIREA